MMNSMPITQITKPEEPKKNAPFAFDVFGKGTVKESEPVIDNSTASMGFDDLFGGMKKDNKPEAAAPVQQNGGSY